MAQFSRVVFVVTLFCTLSILAAAVEPGAGSYDFPDPGTKKTLKIWYFRPVDFGPSTPILFVMHGANRNGEYYRDAWVDHAERHGFMLLVPEFSQENFPGDWGYVFGGYRTKEANDAGYRVVENVFDDFVKNRETSEAKQYYLYGHSAGAQYVHRMLIFVPEARAKLAICANPGRYTMPDLSIEWTYGWKGLKKNEDDLRRYFAQPLVILLGEKDNDPNAARLPRNEKADRQGIHRLERGMNFYRFGKKTAGEMNTPFRWKMQTVPDADHKNAKMAVPAAAMIAEDASKK